MVVSPARPSFLPGRKSVGGLVPAPKHGFVSDLPGPKFAGVPPTVKLGDLVELRKPHACGTNQWVVVRTGVDIRVRCLQCGRSVLMPRTEFLKAVKRLTPAKEAVGETTSEGADSDC